METVTSTIMAIDQITTREEAERFAAQHGIALTKTDLRRVAELEQSAIEQYNPTDNESLVEWFNRYYLKLLQAIEGSSEILFTLMRAVIVSFGVPIVLVLLLFVEQQRVAHGISLFEVNERLAQFGAWAMV